MILNEDNSIAPTGSSSPPPGEFKIGSLSLKLFKRDHRLWIIALIKHWWLLVALPVFFFVVAYLILSFQKPVYKSSALLLRQNLGDNRNNLIPEGFAQMNLVDVINRAHSRENLSKTLEQLNLPDWSISTLHTNTECTQLAKQSNMLLLSATSNDPELSTKIANTLARVFVEEQKRQIKADLEIVKEANIKNRKTIQGTLEQKQEELKVLTSEHKMVSFDSAFNGLSLQISNMESNLIMANITLSSTQKQLEECEKLIGETPSETQQYSEINTEAEKALEQKKLELASLRQVYTEENPIIRKLMAEVELQEAHFQENKIKQTSSSKIVMGKNPVYIDLVRKEIILKNDITGLMSKVVEYTSILNDLKKQRIDLMDLHPKFLELETQINQLQNTLDKLDSGLKILEMFIGRSYSDISIAEDAVKPANPLKTSKKIILMLSLSAGFLLALAIVVFKEFCNLKIRSRSELSDALGLVPLGIIPELTTSNRVDFYSSLQNAVGNGEQILSSMHKPYFLMVTHFESGLDEQFADAVQDILDIKGVNTLYIHSGENPTPEECGFLLNDYLYKISDIPPEIQSGQHFFFKVDDLSFIAEPDMERFKELKEHFKNFDCVIWELFDFVSNPQLFVKFAEQADLLVVALTFNKTNKLTVSDCLSKLKNLDRKKLAGLLFQVKSNYYKWVK